MYKKISLVTVCLLTLLVLASLATNSLYPHASEKVVNISPIIFGEVEDVRMMPTHFYLNKEQNIRVISDFANSRFIHSEFKDNSNWQTSNMPSLRRPHAITYSPKAEKYFAVDTDNHQLISFSSFDSTENNDIQRYSEVKGFSLGKRPHDIAYNPVDNKIYAVLSNGIISIEVDKSDILTADFISKKDIIDAININLGRSDFSVGYIRAISIIDGVIYLSNSTQGNIIRIKDFSDTSTWTAKINKNQGNKYAEKGSFDKNGLIINDVEYFNGYWYATNYYVGEVNNYLSNADIAKNKLIRWATWEDFENSNWQDLSHLVHPESVAYYFTKSDARLYLSMFHGGNKEGAGSGIYEIKTSYF